ncbi:MAG: SDR family oxidoreductase, partial [Gammaproteobacteria bacterium]|nr:SDR family oxidoreductase [Gammaproteobacteria bacterium]
EGTGNYRYNQGDLSDEAFVRDVINNTVVEFGGLDYLVNATGVLWFDRDKSFSEMDLDVWDKVYSINLKSFVLTSRYAVAEMKKRGGGAMVHIASVDALRADLKPQDAYATSKAAIIRFSKSIAIQCAADGIRSNAILPGPVLSPMQQRWQGKADVQASVAQNIPLGRLGTTQDQSNACLFLLSDKASFITGTELVVDGGVTAQ